MEGEETRVPWKVRVSETWHKHKKNPWMWALFIIWLLWTVGYKIALLYGGAKLFGF